MKRLSFFVLFALVSVAYSIGQSYGEKAGNAALADFYSHVKSKSIDVEEFAKYSKQLLELQKKLPSSEVIAEFEQTKNTLIGMLAEAGFFPDNRLDVRKLYGFVAKHYDRTSDKADTSSTLYNFSELMTDYVRDTTILYMLSPGLQTMTLRFIVKGQELTSDFFRTFYVALFVGIINEFDKHIKAESADAEDVRQDTDLPVENDVISDDILIIVDDSITISDDVIIMIDD